MGTIKIFIMINNTIIIIIIINKFLTNLVKIHHSKPITTTANSIGYAKIKPLCVLRGVQIGS